MKFVLGMPSFFTCKLVCIEYVYCIAYSSRISITHLGSLKAHMSLKTAGKAINTKNSSYSCLTALYES